MTLACQFSRDSHDQLTIYRQGADFSTDVPWQENIEYEDEIWLFDHGTNGRASLIIRFRRDGASLIAELYDDRDQDGEVRYEIIDGQVVITESQYWTVQVVSPDGWWIRDNDLNYNIGIKVDGDVEAMFLMEPYRSYLVTDGQPDYDIQIYDLNRDGKPEFDKRMILTPWLQQSAGLATQMMANWADVEIPISEGFSLWPYLHLAHEHAAGSRIVKGYHGTPPPIRFEPATGRIEAIGEFVASRGGEHNCFYYSAMPWVAGQINETNFESPFCFYDLAQDGDRVPELQVRALYFPPDDPIFLRGSVSEPFQLIRYSWDQENSQTWRYAIGLVGRHLMNDRVTFPDTEVLTIPYDVFPRWVTDHDWDMAVFSEFTGKSYFTSEGNYSVTYPEDLMFAEYFTGQSDRVPSPEYEPDVDFRMEWAMDYSSRPYLYFSPVDWRLHLWGAQGGAWNLGKGRTIRYTNLDGDPYLDQWQEEHDGALVRQLNHAGGFWVYRDDSVVRIKRADLDPSLFETLPPSDNAQWQRLGQQLQAHQLESPLEDVASMYSRLPGAETLIRDATLRDYRITPQGFRFILELQDGFSAEHEQNALLPLPQAPGSYVVSYAGGAWSVQPATPAAPRVADLQVISDNGTARALGWSTVEAHVRNDGLEDIRNLIVCAVLDNRAGHQIVLTDTLSLLPGEGAQLVTWDWAPPAAGSWQVQAVAGCSASGGASPDSQAGAGIVLEVSDAAQPSVPWLVSLGGRVPAAIVLFLFATVAVSGVAAAAWVKGAGA